MNILKKRFTFSLIFFAFLLSGCAPKIEQTVYQIEGRSQFTPLEYIKTDKPVDKIEVKEHNVELGKVGEYNIVYSIIVGNKVYEEIVPIKVIDTTPPKIKYTGDTKIQYLSTTDFLSNIVANDTVDGKVDIEVIENNVNLQKIGKYQVKAIAKDSSNNSSEQIINIEVCDILNDYEKMAVKIISFLKKNLKNPESIQVHQVNVVGSESSANYKIDYSAQNGFGGYSRDLLYLSGSTLVETKYSALDLMDISQQFEKALWDELEKDSNEEVKKTVMQQNKYSIVKELDVEKIVRNIK